MDGQNDQNDGRVLGHWQTRYPEQKAKGWIYGEAAYLGLLLFLIPTVMLCLWLEFPKATLGLTPERYDTFSRYLYAWLAGTFGGAMFSIKWLYHTVARFCWNEDRLLWRLFCPHLSGGLAWMFYAIATSGLIRTIDVASLRSPCAVIACSFLVGYFSDSAIGKLKEIADTLFGVRRGKEVRTDDNQETDTKKAAKAQQPSKDNEKKASTNPKRKELAATETTHTPTPPEPTHAPPSASVKK